MIHFDGWSAEYDYWCSRSAVELHPARWCEKHGWDLQPPLSESVCGGGDGMGVGGCVRVCVCAFMPVLHINVLPHPPPRRADQEWPGWDQYLLETEADSADEGLFTAVSACAVPVLLCASTVHYNSRLFHQISFCTHNSSLEGAMELKFVPFYSS